MELKSLYLVGLLVAAAVGALWYIIFASGWVRPSTQEQPSNETSVQSQRTFWRFTSSALGVFLVVVGLVGLFYQGVANTTAQKVGDPAAVQTETEGKKNVPLFPAAGIIAVLGGAVLVGIGQKTG